MEHQGKYTLAVQRGKYGFFAEVALGVTVEAGTPSLLVSIPDPTDASWEAGARFGIAYAFEKAPLRGVRDSVVRVTIKKVRGHAVDTTAVLVACASARAFWDALQLTPPRDIALDDSTGTVLFPK